MRVCRSGTVQYTVRRATGKGEIRQWEDPKLWLFANYRIAYFLKIQENVDKLSELKWELGSIARYSD